MTDRTQLTPEQVRENFYKKVQQARSNNQMINEERAIRKQKEAYPELFNLVETVANRGGMPMLKQLHSILGRYISMCEYNGGRG